MIRTIITCAVFGLVTSCTAASLAPSSYWPSDMEIEQYNASVPAEQRIACFNERELGTRFKRKTCYRMSDLEKQQANTRSLVNAMQAASRAQSVRF